MPHPHDLRRFILKIPVNKAEREAVRLAVMADESTTADWARRRLFGEAIIANPVIEGMTSTDKSAHALVLLATIATRLEDLLESQDPFANDDLAELRGWYREIVETINSLFRGRSLDLASPAAGGRQ